MILVAKIETGEGSDEIGGSISRRHPDWPPSFDDRGDVR
jgi:hypothetical protein